MPPSPCCFFSRQFRCHLHRSGNAWPHYTATEPDHTNSKLPKDGGMRPSIVGLKENLIKKERRYWRQIYAKAKDFQWFSSRNTTNSGSMWGQRCGTNELSLYTSSSTCFPSRFFKFQSRQLFSNWTKMVLSRQVKSAAAAAAAVPAGLAKWRAYRMKSLGLYVMGPFGSSSSTSICRICECQGVANRWTINWNKTLI